MATDLSGEYSLAVELFMRDSSTRIESAEIPVAEL